MKENCVMCGKQLETDKNTHIDYRTNWVDGAGELCVNCYDEVYRVETPTNDDWID
jgi:hypothetical protein